MDRTRTCGVRNVGSIPAEGTMETLEKIREKNEEVAILRNEVKNLRALKELHEDSLTKDSTELIENELDLSDQEKDSIRERIMKSRQILEEVKEELATKEPELEKLEEEYGIKK